MISGCKHVEDRVFERGVALISVLIFLLVMTIIGAAAMQSSTLQQWMSGSTQDQNVAFQTAEAGVSQGEQWLGQAGWNVGNPPPGTTFPLEQKVDCPGQPCNVVWPYDNAANIPNSSTRYLDATFWETIVYNPLPTSQPLNNIWVGTIPDPLAPPEVRPAAPPYLVIENVSFLRGSRGSNKWSSDPEGGQLYQVTSRGTGRSLNAHSVIQTTYMLGE